jgi:hypothetical protein
VVFKGAGYASPFRAAAMSLASIYLVGVVARGLRLRRWGALPEE